MVDDQEFNLQMLKFLVFKFPKKFESSKVFENNVKNVLSSMQNSIKNDSQKSPNFN